MASVERIDLPDGAWWDIRTVYTRGIRRAITQASLRAAPGIVLNGDSSEEAIREKMLANPQNIDPTIIEDAYLLAGSVAYSYGPTVELATIDGLPDSVVQRVLGRLVDLYSRQQMPQDKEERFFENSSRPS